MKKSVWGMLAICALAGQAHAQSSVVIFGKIDQAFGKPIATKDRQIIDTAGSRLAFRGTEDLGGGFSALFAFEHRFKPDSGNVATPATFWDGFSYMGLRSTTYGTVTLGRQYTSAFLTVQNQVDPFAGETVAGLRTIFTGAAYGTSPATLDQSNAWTGSIAGLGPSKGRNPDMIKYAHTFGPIAFSADIAETPVGFPDRPFTVAGSYDAGPIWLGASFEDAAGTFDQVINVGGRYKIGRATLSAGLTDGRINSPTNNKLRAWLVGAVVPIGAGDIKAGYAASKVAGVARNARLGLGYHHNLSKRTKVYADVAHESKGITTNKMGYDLGVQHQF